MWYLISKQSEKITYLLANKKYKVGRLIEGQPNDNDISIGSDQSISRLHAELLIKYDENECTNIESKPNIILTDHSKFGTSVNESKVEGFRPLKPNDVIKFGVYKSIYQLCYDPLIVTTSCLNSTNKTLVKSRVCRLGGHLVNDWQNECSLVVMDSITVTVKVIDALICQKHVVTIDYLNEMVRCIETGEKLPNTKDFLPPIGEKNLEGKKLDFEPLAIRKVLFRNKKFVFFDSVQLQKTQNIIELACGKCELFNSTTHLDPKILKSNRDSFIFIQNNDSRSKSVKDNQSRVEVLLKSINQVLIDESDIGLAILFAEIKDHCNPNTTAAERLVKDKLASQTLLDTYFAFDSIGFRSRVGETQETQIDHDFESKKGGKSKDDEEDEVMIVSESPPPPQRQLRSTKQQTSKTSPSSSSLSINKPSKVSEKSTIISIDVNESETTKKLDHRKVETRSRQQPKNSTTDTDKNKTTSDFDLLKRGFDDNDDEEAGFEQQKATTTTTTTNKQVAIIRDEEPISKSTSSSKPPSSKRNKLEKEDESKKIIVEQENTPSVAKDVIRVKNEPVNVNDDLTLEPKKRSVGLTSRTNLNATTVVYSKNKPPPESLIKHETSMPLDESISEIKVKVKFEPMIKRSSIKRENTSTLGSSSSSGGENTQRNFKKFKKVPKASQKAVGEKSIFKSVKQEKFDLDSQFNEFMNSMR